MDAIIQARLGASRFPRKMLHPVAGVPLIERVIGRLRAAPAVRRVVVATTESSGDDELARFCEARGALVFRGSTDRVLDRMIGAAEAFGSERFLRVCADNPLLDPTLADAVAANLATGVDYASHETAGGEPIILKPLGLCVEGVSLAALRRVATESRDPLAQEHVTMHIYRHPADFAIRWIPLPAGLDPDWRFTVDYPDDIRPIEAILADDPAPDAARIGRFVAGHPEIAAAMADTVRKFPKVYPAPR